MNTTPNKPRYCRRIVQFTKVTDSLTGFKELRVNGLEDFSAEEMLEMVRLLTSIRSDILVQRHNLMEGIYVT